MEAAGASPASAEADVRQGTTAASALTRQDPAENILQHTVHCLQAACILADRPVASQQLSGDQSAAGTTQQPDAAPPSMPLEALRSGKPERPVANGTAPREAVQSAAVPLDVGMPASLTGDGTPKPGPAP